MVPHASPQCWLCGFPAIGVCMVCCESGTNCIVVSGMVICNGLSLVLVVVWGWKLGLCCSIVRTMCVHCWRSAWVVCSGLVYFWLFWFVNDFRYCLGLDLRWGLGSTMGMLQSDEVPLWPFMVSHPPPWRDDSAWLLIRGFVIWVDSIWMIFQGCQSICWHHHKFVAPCFWFQWYWLSRGQCSDW